MSFQLHTNCALLSDAVDAKTQERIMSHRRSNVIKSSLAKKIGPMLPETEAMLRKFFAPFNEQLADVIGDDRFKFES